MTVNSAVTDTNWGPNFDPGRPYGDPLFSPRERG